MRSERRRKVGMMGLAVGMMITVGLIVGVFSSIPHEWLKKEWPLGIQLQEVQRYAEVADLRQIETEVLVDPKGEVFYIGGDQCVLDDRSATWERTWFEAPGYGDSIMIRPSVEVIGAYEIMFNEQIPFRGQQGMLLIPSDPELIRMKYAEVVAKELGLATPAIGIARVVGCGKEYGTFITEETINEGFLARRRFSEAVLFERSFDPDAPDQALPELTGNDTAHASLLRSMFAMMLEDAERGRLDKLGHTIDDQAAAGWFLMHWLEGATDPLYQKNYFAFHWNRGKFTPLHRPSHQTMIGEKEPGPLAANIFTPWLKVPSFQETFRARRSELGSKWSTIEEQLNAVDTAWVPVLANTTISAQVEAIADRTKQQFRDRFQEGDPIAYLDRPVIAGNGVATLMQGQEAAKRYWPTESEVDRVQAIVKKYRVRMHGDSIVFPRGKYQIDEDLIVPPGYGLILLEGARFFMSPGVNVLCQGSFHIRGSKLRPVFIRAVAGPFGTVAMLGDGETKCTLSGLQISGGSGARINGIQFNGMVSIQDASATRAQHCIISAPATEVGLSIQGGELTMENSTCITGKVELRDVNGSIANTQLQGGTSRSGNGGLIVHSSTLRIEELRAWAVSGTALSFNESKAHIINTNISQCDVGVAAADLSDVHLSECSITGNKIGLSAQRVRPMLGGSKITVYNSDLSRNATERSIDEHSSIEEKERSAEQMLGAEEVSQQR